MIYSRTQHLIKRALKFISENAVKGIEPKDVAVHLGISRTLLDLRFREMETKTVGEFITERRIAILSAMLKKIQNPCGPPDKGMRFRQHQPRQSRFQEALWHDNARIPPPKSVLTVNVELILSSLFNNWNNWG